MLVGIAGSDWQGLLVVTRPQLLTRFCPRDSMPLDVQLSVWWGCSNSILSLEAGTGCTLVRLIQAYGTQNMLVSLVQEIYLYIHIAIAAAVLD
jgi:hypothetical protein